MHLLVRAAAQSLIAPDRRRWQRAAAAIEKALFGAEGATASPRRLARMSTRPLGTLRGPMPIVIGVTGHRDLRPQDVPHLETRVRAIFAEFRRTYPNTPLLVVSALAAGADQLVARVALAPPYEIPVIVPMPFEQAEYELDFAADEREVFRDLLARARHSFFVGYAEGNDGTAIGMRAGRALQYAEVGAFVARNCQALIALWDGRHSERIGGTSWVVDMMLRGRATGTKR